MGHGKRGGDGEMDVRNNKEAYITICKIDSQGEFAVWLGKDKWAPHPPRGLGWGRRWEGSSKGRGIYIYTYD